MQQLGRYEILAELGHGAMGTVYRARDPKIERIVALKTVRLMGATPEQESEYRRRFFREAQSAGKLSHPGIVTIYDVGEDEVTQTPYIVMEYIEGSTLESLLSRMAPAAMESLRLIQQVAEALDYAHAREIIHRDIKPANIIVTPGGQPKITDFGIAKLPKSEFTVPGQILGTLAYLAPEQLKGGSLDGRADLFSLGVILYWMLTGRKPFEGDTSTIVYQVACQDPPAITDLKPDLSEEINRVVLRALAKDPDQRYRRGMELADDLADLQAGRAPRWANQAMSTAVGDETLVEGNPLASEKTVVELPSVAASIPPQIPDAGSHLRDRSSRVPDTRPTSRTSSSAIAGFSASARQFLGGLSPKARIAIVASFVFLLLLPFLFQRATSGLIQLDTPTVVLQVESQHNFRSAELSIWVDGELVEEADLVGAERRRFFRTTVQGNFSGSLRVPVGKRTVRVRVRSEADGYDQTREAEVEFQEDRPSTLILGFNGRDRDLSLSWIK